MKMQGNLIFCRHAKKNNGDNIFLATKNPNVLFTVFTKKESMHIPAIAEIMICM